MQRIGFIVFPGFNVMTCAVIAAFELANREMGEPVYDVRLLSETGGSAYRGAARSEKSSRSRGGASSARGGSLHKIRSDGFGLRKNHL